MLGVSCNRFSNFGTQEGRFLMNADDAMLIFGKLRDEDAVVFCSGRLFGINFLLRGKVSKLDSEQVDMTSVDGEATIALSLVADGLVFGYREPRDFPDFAKELPKEARTVTGLTIEFPDRGLMPFPEGVVIVEVLPDEVTN
jgi:hypothetical protein